MVELIHLFIYLCRCLNPAQPCPEMGAKTISVPKAVLGWGVGVEKQECFLLSHRLSLCHSRT